MDAGGRATHGAVAEKLDDRAAVTGIGKARTFHSARVVKLVDTGDLKSPDLNSRAGSSPAPGTIYPPNMYNLLVYHLEKVLCGSSTIKEHSALKRK